MNKYAGTQTEKNLQTAFAGESQARNKYTYFSAVAKQEGLDKIADIFAKTANNEEQHAKMWFEELGGIGDTTSNLNAAADGENYEWTDMYDGFAKTAEKEGFTSSQLKKSEIKVWECLKCGHIAVGPKAPDFCTVCNEANAYFEVREDNYDLILTWGR